MSGEQTICMQPARNITGALRMPGDKSISHRYAMLAGIAEGSSRLENFSSGADCSSTVGCMEALGCRVERLAGNSVVVHGRGLSLAAPSHPLDCGNSGSTMRMLSGILAGQSFASELFGDESLSRRPMKRVVEPLTAMGARIQAGPEQRPPLRIAGGRLRAIEYKLPIASAQVKTSLLFAGLYAEGTTRVEEPVRTRDHGEIALRAFGAEVERHGKKAGIAGGQKLHAIDASIPGDLSSAAFFLCAAALFRDSNLVIDNLLLNPTRAVLLDVLTSMGVQISMVQVEEQHGEVAGTIRVEPGDLRGATIAGAQSAALIDELPVLAAIAPYTREGIEIRDASELRVKESNRIAAVTANLRLMGAEVEEREDGWSIPGGQRLYGAEVESYGDHRIAMAFGVAALRAEGATLIKGADAARISFPEFFQYLEQVAER